MSVLKSGNVGVVKAHVVAGLCARARARGGEDERGVGR